MAITYKVVDHNDRLVRKDIPNEKEAISLCMGLDRGGEVMEEDWPFTPVVFNNKR